MKRHRLNLILVVVALGLVAGVALMQKRDEAKAKREPLTTLKTGEVNKITLKHPNTPDIVLEKKDGQWALTAPVAVAADSVEVSNITALAAAETHASIDPAQVRRADLGLDPPAYTVTLNDQTLGFGGVEPLKYHRYVQHMEPGGGGKIELIDDIGGQALDADYSDLVAKTLLPD